LQRRERLCRAILALLRQAARLFQL